MSRIKGPNFSVRFYRRGIVQPSVRQAGGMPALQDNAYTEPAPQTPVESPQAMNESFEPAIKPELHISQELTAPKEKPRTAPEPVFHTRAAREIDYHHEHTSPRETPVDKKDLQEKALWIAAKNGDCPAIRLLVMSGVDLEARDAQGRTALNIATQHGQKDATKTLLAAKEMRTMARLGELPRGAFFDKFQKTSSR